MCDIHSSGLGDLIPSGGGGHHGNSSNGSADSPNVTFFWTTPLFVILSCSLLEYGAVGVVWFWAIMYAIIHYNMGTWLIKPQFQVGKGHLHDVLGYRGRKWALWIILPILQTSILSAFQNLIIGTPFFFQVS